jgi:ABC-type molybdenum transport system ATPase subunit/photorepair protein PhrA
VKQPQLLVWARLGLGQLTLQTLLSRHRIHPATPPPGPFPHITSLLTPTSSTSFSLPESTPKPVRHLAFARPPTTGEFTDFTARYGALQEEDKLSFRQTLSALHPAPSDLDIERAAEIMRITHLLDLPSVSLSSGQTRRARIAAALLTRPALLLLEDPMAGLDVRSREEVSRILGELNQRGDIRVVLVLRGKGAEDIPAWVTDVCEVRGRDAWIGSRDEWDGRTLAEGVEESAKVEEIVEAEEDVPAEPLVRLQDVTVSYGEGTRQVLKGVSWAIKPGERWHLQGANGMCEVSLHFHLTFPLASSA